MVEYRQGSLYYLDPFQRNERKSLRSVGRELAAIERRQANEQK